MPGGSGAGRAAVVVGAPAPGTPLDVSLLDDDERRRAAALQRPAERAL
ncbi:hypothetical protein [Streptomyces prunicolor]